MRDQAQALWAKLTGWGQTLTLARQDVQAMQAALARYPQQLAGRRSVIQALANKQRELETRYAQAKADIKKILDSIRSWVPGLSGLGIGPFVIPVVWAVAAIGAAIALGAAISYHFSAVSAEKALIAQLSPEAAREELEKRRSEGGFFSEAKNLVILGIVAAVVLPLLTRR